MALAQYFTGYRLGSSQADTTVEIYLDYLCPFSKKAFDRIFDDVQPLVEKKWPGKVAFVFRHQVQPWHPQATLLHEAAIAVHKRDPKKFWQYSKILFRNQNQFGDSKTNNKSRSAIYSELADLAAQIGVDRDAVLALLKVSEEDERGNQITPILKAHLKISRQNSIHVSPTVLVNGLIENGIESSWDAGKWEGFLAERVSA